MKVTLALLLSAPAVVVARMRLQTAAEPMSDFDIGCYEEDDKGKSYKGLTTSTASGRTCQNWLKDKPHKIDIEVSQENGLGNHNYCRNPDGPEDKPWCFTMDPNPDKKKETCEVPVCPGMARDFKDEAAGLSTKMAPSFDCACLATLHALGGGASLVQLAKTNALGSILKTNSTAMTKKGKVVHGKCVCN